MSDLSEKLDAIAKLEREATPGPWTHDEAFNASFVCAGEGTVADSWIVRMDSRPGRIQDKADTAFIAAARTDVPFLLGLVRELQAKLSSPCGSCHPCTEWANQTWVNAGERLPHFHDWQELKARAEEQAAKLEAVAAVADRYKGVALDTSVDLHTRQTAGLCAGHIRICTGSHAMSALDLSAIKVRIERLDYVIEYGSSDPLHASAVADLKVLHAAVTGVLGIHEPVDAAMYSGNRQYKVQVCTGCGQDDGNWQRWPCPTVKALEPAP